ncbi:MULTISPECIES: acetylornithine transaminase [Aerococcus]|uniref:Acetylornithine aminotransferase n=2 Tax=Aerococcus TaxID=1375 RepID=A0A5N1GLF2_9LACT|nr:MULTISPECIES: acetylornithine transaminase [Aerococcus]KAA9301805.1 acetylornithine transaminase [Aerococcus sanguinicola]MDK6368775.1 acetylornithine transaminase [Aerococcus sp. UMB9870]MDK6679323.1 acetylornithine transaminase [Aerococcus sp. UMB8608]MDK6685835.1 acetylornithine transaminase [Aerococcus sp. UMB8623]
MTSQKEWSQRGQAALLNLFNRADRVMAKGEGAYLYDTEGKAYLDFMSGIAVNALGHAHPALLETLTAQAKQGMHFSNYYWNTPAIELAEKLSQKTGLGQAFFCNSGTEANEAAIKLARKWGRENKGEEAIQIISCQQSFHGRTMGALAATGQATLQAPFAPMLAGFSYVPYNDCQALKQVVNQETCAIMVEPIQGEGGVHPMSQAFAQTLKELQAEANILLIMDEVQTGVGRTGHFLASPSYGLEADMLTLAKGLAGGFPIAALLAGPKIQEIVQPGDHGSTFGGNPLACALAHTVLDVIDQDQLLANVKARSQQLQEGLAAISQELGGIVEVRGQGLLLGIEVSVPVGELCQACYDAGLLLVTAKGNVIRFLPALNVTEEECDQALHIFAQVLDELQTS